MTRIKRILDAVWEAFRYLFLTPSWGSKRRRAVHKRISADDRERLEWYGMDRDFDPEYLNQEECQEIVEAFNS